VSAQISPLYFFRVSSLSHSELCTKRSKIELFSKFTNNYSTGAVATGNRFHHQYSLPYKDFDRVRCRAFLGEKVFSKQIDDIQIRGIYDDLKIVRYHDKKYASLIEIKTTAKPYLWTLEIKAAIRQLQLYMWIMKDDLEKIGYPLWKRGYVEIYSQHSGLLIKRIAVEYDYDIEEWVRSIVKQFKGLAKTSPPPYQYCKMCPVQVKKICDWYFLRSRKNELSSW
jgi:CRISPR/Cas system-associated exonuclease Cas4 (RecB family)